MVLPEQTDPELAAAVKRVLVANGDGFRPMTLVQAAEQTGVSASTIQYMSVGKKVGCEHIIRFARAFGEDASDWLVWGGYPDIAEYMRQGNAQPAPRNEFDDMFQKLPPKYRKKVRTATKTFVENLIMPLLTETAA